MRLVATATALLLGGCATTDVPKRAAWGDQCHPDLIASIESLVGPEAVDCGFFNLPSRKLSSRIGLAAQACVNDAIQRGQPFKYGTLRLPIDSFVTEVIARDSDGKLWFIARDVMLGEDTFQQWNQVCQEVGVDPHTMVVDASHCVEKSHGRLVVAQ